MVSFKEEAGFSAQQCRDLAQIELNFVKKAPEFLGVQDELHQVLLCQGPWADSKCSQDEMRTLECVHLLEAIWNHWFANKPSEIDLPDPDEKIQCGKTFNETHEVRAMVGFFGTFPPVMSGTCPKTAGHPFPLLLGQFCPLVYCPGRWPIVCRNRLGHQNYYF